MKVNKKSNVRNKLKEYYLGILKEILTPEELNSINTELISYDNNKSGLVRVIGCPYRSGVGGVIYILKSSKYDTARYNIVNAIYVDELGLVATSVSILTDSKKSQNNLLAFTCINKDGVKVYLYSKFLNKDMIERTIFISNTTSRTNNDGSKCRMRLFNLITLINNILIFDDNEDNFRVFNLKPTLSALLIKEDIGNGFFRHI